MLFQTAKYRVVQKAYHQVFVISASNTDVFDFFSLVCLQTRSSDTANKQGVSYAFRYSPVSYVRFWLD